MEPTIKMIQTVQGDDVKWRNLGEQELRDYFSFRMDTVVVDSSQEFQPRGKNCLRLCGGHGSQNHVDYPEGLRGSLYRNGK